MKRISEITRRDVFNLFLYGIDKNTDFGTELLHYNYSGKLSELDFLKRIYNLEQLPSYDKAQTLPLPEMYGKNLTFKTGGVDGCDCEETLRLIAEGRIDTEPLITHIYPLRRIEEGYDLFEHKRDGVIKVAVEC